MTQTIIQVNFAGRRTTQAWTEAGQDLALHHQKTCISGWPQSDCVMVCWAVAPSTNTRLCISTGFPGDTCNTYRIDDPNPQTTVD